MPSHDTFSRVLRLTSFENLSSSLGEWLRGNFPETYEKYGGHKVLHIDGKAVKAASEKARGENPVYHLNAMYEGESVGLEIKRVGEKENEISCLPEYLKQFNLADTIVTIDAIGCNQTVIRAMHDGGGKYVLPVKENQKKLLETNTAEIEKRKKEKTWDTLEMAESMNKGHGRMEKVEFTDAVGYRLYI